MPTGSTSGKRKGLERVSDSRGVIAALAIDQRTALRSLIAKAKGVIPEAIPGEMLVEFKEAASRILTQHSEYSLPTARARATNAGLLLAYEQSGYDKAIPGRLPHLLEHWSAKRLVDAGADCVKILLYYSPSSSTEINDSKHAWVECIGAECCALDVPLFLELVSTAKVWKTKAGNLPK